MSLKIWLPLTEASINNIVPNYGLNAIYNEDGTIASTIDVTNHKTTCVSGGKIGKCYSFNGTDSYLSFTDLTLDCTQLSLSAWFYANSKTTGTIASFNTNTSADIAQCAVALCLTTSGISFMGAGVSCSANYTAKTWYHATITVDNGHICGYLNGKLVGEADGSTVTATTFTVGATSSNGTINTSLNGYLNDVRLYDHTLSADEVKEISKGLFLSYRLAGPSPSYQYSKDSTEYHTLGYDNKIEYDGSGYLRNGTIVGELEWDTNSSRFATSYYFTDDGAEFGSKLNEDFLEGFRLYLFSAENCITFSNKDLQNITNGTIAIWARVTNFKTEWTAVSTIDQTASIIQLYKTTGDTCRCIGAGSNLKVYIDGVENNIANLDGEWHHYVITGVDLSGWSDIKIHNGDSKASYNDFRIYATSLSAEDVDKLYHDAVIVDRTGKDYAYEYFEM